MAAKVALAENKQKVTLVTNQHQIKLLLVQKDHSSPKNKRF